ncbi:hypothetical protein NTGHW29_50003 [Candidatus Nitrotoga sp. HW29]|nr:hypothetical protein NTGHW29_50003 [Candidatus Nitrotoga sp. HW29]
MNSNVLIQYTAVRSLNGLRKLVDMLKPIFSKYFALQNSISYFNPIEPTR